MSFLSFSYLRLDSTLYATDQGTHDLLLDDVKSMAQFVKVSGEDTNWALS